MGNMHNTYTEIHSELRAAVASSRTLFVNEGETILEADEADIRQTFNADISAGNFEDGTD